MGSQSVPVCRFHAVFHILYYRLYPCRTQLQSVKWYKAGQKIVYQDAVDGLQDAEEVSGNLNSVVIGPM